MWLRTWSILVTVISSFNTASGMRSHVTYVTKYSKSGNDFVSIPQAVWDHMWRNTYCWNIWRYLVSIPQAVWDHMWPPSQESGGAAGGAVSIPQAVWDHMWPAILIVTYMGFTSSSFNTASGMRSHVTMALCRMWAHLWAFQYRKRYEITCDHF